MKARTNYINQEQMNQMIMAIPDLKIRKWNDSDIAMLFKICYWLALRMGEAIRLNAEDFDLLRLECYLGKTKTEKEDYATIPMPFLPELTLYLLDKKGPLFPKLNYHVVYSWIIKLGKLLNISALQTSQYITGEKTKTHIFRKSMAKDMLFGTHTPGRKAPVNIISKQLRHKGKNAMYMTERYLRVDNETVKDWWKEEPSNNNTTL